MALRRRGIAALGFSCRVRARVRARARARVGVRVRWGAGRVPARGERVARLGECWG